MSVLFVIDPLERLEADIDSSVGLMAATQSLGAEVWVCQPEDLSVVEGRVVVNARRISLRPRTPNGDHRWRIEAPWFVDEGHRTVDVAEVMALVVLRIDPPVDARYLHTTYVLDLVVQAGVKVTNSPTGIRIAHEKMLALHFPGLCPPTLVAANQDQICGFVDEHDRVVIKPVDGFAGTDVWLLRAGDPSVPALVESATRHGARQVIVQRYLPAVETGNKRLFLLAGEIIGAVDRRPAGADFRIGPPVSATTPDRHDLRIVRTLAPYLAQHGLDLAGIDVIGGQLIEVNLTCPGGLHKTDALLGTHLCDLTMRHQLHTPTERLQPCPN